MWPVEIHSLFKSPPSEAPAAASTVRPTASGQVGKLQKPSILVQIHPSSHQFNFYVYSPAPCQPQGVRGNLDCVTNSAWISWDAAPGADSYTVSAVSGEDHTANCTTSSNTTCEVEDLACGVLYNFSVIAKNSRCESRPSATIDLQTGNRFLK